MNDPIRNAIADDQKASRSSFTQLPVSVAQDRVITQLTSHRSEAPERICGHVEMKDRCEAWCHEMKSDSWLVALCRTVGRLGSARL